MNYAWIDNGTVTNLIWLRPRNAHEFPQAVPCGDVPVQIGDTYDGERFYRDGEMLLTESEKLAAELEDAKTALELLGVNTDE